MAGAGSRLTLIGVAFWIAACGGDPGVEIWRFAIEEIEGSVQHAYAAAFEERVEERTAGAVDVRVYPYGALGTSAQLTEQVQSGALQLAFASPGHLGSVVPEVQVFSLHFVFSDDAAVNRRALADPDLRALLSEAYRERSLTLLGVLSEGWMVWTSDKPLRSPGDFAGFKMRTMVSPLLLEAYRAYGAAPTALPYAEVYSALQLEMIDGQVNPVFAIEEMSFFEVQDVMTFANHLPFLTSLVANPAFHDALPPERRALLHEVVAQVDGEIFAHQERLNAERLEKIRRAGGTEIVTLDESERAAFRRASLPVRDRFVELAGPRGAAVLDALVEAVKRAEAEPAEDAPGGGASAR